MTTTNLLDPEHIKDAIALDVFVSQQPEFSTTPQWQRKIGGNGHVKFYSPFTSESTPSFTVFNYNKTWKDFSTGKGGNSDIFQLLEDLRGWNFAQAVDELRRWLNSPTYEQVKIELRTQQRKKETHWTAERLSKVMTWGVGNRHEAADYFESRGISDFYSFQFMLGRIPHTYYYPDPDGGADIALKAHAFSIPYLFRAGDKTTVRSIELRVDEESLREAWLTLELQSPDKAELIMDDVMLTYGWNKEQFMNNMVKGFGIPKYKRWGENRFLFNANRLVRHDGKSITYPRLNQVLVVESAFDAVMLENLGYAAVAIPQHAEIDLALAFRNVGQVIPLFDNDDAGRAKLEDWIERIGYQKCRAVEPLQGFKDPGAVRSSEGGAARLEKWLSDNFVEKMTLS